MAFLKSIEQLVRYLPTDEDIKNCDGKGNLIYIDEEFYQKYPLYAYVYAEHGFFIKSFKVRFFLYKTDDYYSLLIADEERDFTWLTEFKVLPGGIRSGINKDYYKRITNYADNTGIFIMCDNRLKKVVFFGTDDADDIDVNPDAIKNISFKGLAATSNEIPFVDDMILRLNDGIINTKRPISKTKIVFKYGKAVKVENETSKPILKVVPPPPPPPSTFVYGAIDSQKKPSEALLPLTIVMTPQGQNKANTSEINKVVTETVETEIVYV